MTANAGRDIPAIIAAYDFTTFDTIVDVGGGHGALIAAILQVKPALRGILFDQPHVVADAAPVLEAAGVADRCAIVGGSFFERVPPGSDAYAAHPSRLGRCGECCDPGSVPQCDAAARQARAH